MLARSASHIPHTEAGQLRKRWRRWPSDVTVVQANVLVDLVEEVGIRIWNELRLGRTVLGIVVDEGRFLWVTLGSHFLIILHLLLVLLTRLLELLPLDRGMWPLRVEALHCLSSLLRNVAISASIRNLLLMAKLLLFERGHLPGSSSHLPINALCLPSLSAIVPSCLDSSTHPLRALD